ncbi:MAG: hypothetical protein C7B47_17035 [Sulfobacillus thermosulfidooxidans]|uniref:Serine dehydrogenase proteinase n=1 Tax=Sulfobacillus thermosulfidooxidans TaxID=28034 RepID=A0A2T2WI09_SULTH|nr:MAG: hypothetical protein C7B47_17035 [Sulfobacillus thermosulfidooxidans]
MDCGEGQNERNGYLQSNAQKLLGRLRRHVGQLSARKGNGLIVNTEIRELVRLSQRVSEKYDADIILYSGDLEERSANDFLKKVVQQATTKRNVWLILRTYGGDPNAAFKIARVLQQKYAEVVGIVERYCKSAGTLLLLGADRIIMTDEAELGPIDVQLYKPDQLGERSSGLTHRAYLKYLKENAFEQFESFFLDIRFKSGMQLSSQFAARVATDIVVGLLSPVYAQIDLVRIGESERAMDLARSYAKRLSERSKNLNIGSIEKLLFEYPDHGFVIDFEEALEIFRHVERPQDSEDASFVRLLDPVMELIGKQEDTAPFVYLKEVLDTLDEKGDASHEANAGESEDEPSAVPATENSKDQEFRDEFADHSQF